MTGPRLLMSLVALLSTFACRRAIEADDDQLRNGPSLGTTNAPTSRATSAEHVRHGSPSAEPAPEHAAHGQSAETPGNSAAAVVRASPAGYTSISVPAAQARAIGLQTASVEERELSRLVRTTGVVVLDETRTSHVHSKVRGWIESVNADFVGKSITAGAPLCTIYSQEVLAAQIEFLSVLDQTENAPGLSGALGDAERGARDQLMAAARRRLELWDVPAAEIARLTRTREPRRTFTLDAPRSGVIVSKQALAGTYVDPSVELYVISDVRKLWVVASLHASDLPGVQLGAPATLSIEGQPMHVAARVAFLPPMIEESTRTLEVRFNVDNAEGAIRPGAFASIELRVDLGRSLGIPEPAVIHAGPEAIVFVVKGDQIEPRSVQLGSLVDGYYGVRSGVEAGESVAIGAQFLIDSESRLRATSGKGPTHGGH